MKTHVVLFILLISTWASAQVRLSVTTPVTLQNLRDKSRPVSTHAAGEAIEISKSGVWLLQPDSRLPVLLYGTSDEAAPIELDPPSIETSCKPFVSRELENNLEDLAIMIVNLQTLVARRDVQELEKQIAAFESRHPGVEFVHFFRASAAVLKGNRSGALESVQKGLKKHPRYAPGLELKAQLEKGL